jgi:hypothetical protein
MEASENRHASPTFRQGEGQVMLRLSRALITGLRSPAIKVARVATLVVILILLFIAIKIPWVMHFRTDGAKLIANAEKIDVLERRAYLVDRYRSRLFSSSNMPVLLDAHRLIGGNTEFDDLHGKITEALARRLREAPFPYLETYPGRISTADNTVAIASLKLYDQIFGDDHGDIYARWLKHTKDHLLDPTGLIVFRVGSNGKSVGCGRGTGIA